MRNSKETKNAIFLFSHKLPTPMALGAAMPERFELLVIGKAKVWKEF